MPLDGRSSSLRSLVLAPSGGWLGEGTMVLSDLLGLWDIFVLMTFFVVFWVIIRTAIPEIALPLGLIFDLGIPLQYQNNKSLKRLHHKHLSGYWAIWIMGTAAEAGGFLMLLPDMFTLIVCIKTTVCTCLWLSKKADGSREVRFGSLARRSGATPSSSSASSGAGTGRGSGIGSSPSAIELRGRAEAEYPGIETALKAAGWDYLTREGMMGHFLSKLGENKRTSAFNDIKRWSRPGVYTTAERAARKEEMTKRALKRRQRRDGRSDGRSTNNQRSVAGSQPPRRRPRINHPIIPAPTVPARARRGLTFTNAQLAALQAKARGKRSDADIAKIIHQLRQTNAPDMVEKLLGSLGIVTPDGAIPHLHDKIPVDVQRGRYQRLIRGENENDGLGLPADMANLMILDMMNQQTLEDANRLYDSWKQIRSRPPAERARLRGLLRDYYTEDLDLPSGMTYLRMPWQGAEDRDA